MYKLTSKDRANDRTIEGEIEMSYNGKSVDSIGLLYYKINQNIKKGKLLLKTSMHIL